MTYLLLTYLLATYWCVTSFWFLWQVDFQKNPLRCCRGEVSTSISACAGFCELTTVFWMLVLLHALVSNVEHLYDAGAHRPVVTLPTATSYINSQATSSTYLSRSLVEYAPRQVWRELQKRGVAFKHQLCRGPCLPLLK